MITTSQTILDALRDIAGYSDQIYERAAKDGVFKIVDRDLSVNTTSEGNQQDIFFWLLRECDRRQWDWHASSEDDGYVFIVITHLMVEDDGELNATRYKGYSFDVNGSPTHAAVLAFLKAIKGESE